MNNFEKFVKKHGPPIHCQAADDKMISMYKKLLPAEFIELWKTVGFCSYGKGFLWVVNPNQLKDVMTDWFPRSNDRRIPILRTAFCDIIFWDKEGAHLLEVQRGNIHDIGKDISILFWYWLCENDVLDNVLKYRLFKKVLPKYGPLTFDECYAFKLALALGGDDDVKNMAKVKMKEQLSILSQIVER